jgi:hypothetical protein
MPLAMLASTLRLISSAASITEMSSCSQISSSMACLARLALSLITPPA